MSRPPLAVTPSKAAGEARSATPTVVTSLSPASAQRRGPFDMRGFLERAGVTPSKLNETAGKLEANDITPELLPEVTNDDLKE